MPTEVEKRKRINARHVFLRDWQGDLAPRRKRKPSEWAEQVRKVPQGGPLSPLGTTGYSHEWMGHAVEIMDAADNPDVRMIVNWSGIRDSKTSICLCILGRTVTEDPGGIYSVHPTDDDVAKFSNDDVEPMIELCLEKYFVQKKSRDSGRTIGFKKFIGGSLRIVSAGSLTKFRGSTVKVLFLHEADALVIESIYKALGRTEGLSDAIIVMESTGTNAPGIGQNGETVYNSVIHEHYEKGDMRKWFCKCADCGALQWLKYRQFKWPTGKMEQAKYHCERCDYGHNEKEWRHMVKAKLFGGTAEWHPTAGLTLEQQQDIAKNHVHARPKQPEVRSYWRNGFNSLLPKGKGYKTKLHEFVARGEAAKSSKEALKTWTNEIAAELWDASGSTEAPPDWKKIFDRREGYILEGNTSPIIPARGLVLTAGVDVHKNRLEVTWGAYGRKEEYWGIMHNVLMGEVQDEAVWKELERELRREFRHETGATKALDFALVDGGKWPDWVYRFLSMLAHDGSDVQGRVRACRGASQKVHPLIDPVFKSLAKNLKGHWVGTHEAKDLIYTRLKKPIGENGEIPEGYRHYPMSFPQVHFEQLVSERVSILWERGEEIRLYTNEEHARNEALDTEVYGLAAFRVRRWNYDAIEADLRAQAQPVEEIRETKPIPKRNWITGR